MRRLSDAAEKPSHITVNPANYLLKDIVIKTVFMQVNYPKNPSPFGCFVVILPA